MVIVGETYSPKCIDKHLIDNNDPNATSASLNIVMADDTWYNSQTRLLLGQGMCNFSSS